VSHTFRARQGQRPVVILVEADQPRLWQEVRGLAAAAGTPPPEEIGLVADVVATLADGARTRGLRRRSRRLELGVPLMLGLSTDQLRAVVGRELGGGPAGATDKPSLTAETSDTEGAATPNAEELARREIPALDAAWSHFSSVYGRLGADIGRRPEALFEGFYLFLEAHATDLADNALGLIDDLDATIDRLEDRLYDDPALVRTPWPELIETDAATRTADQAARLLDAAAHARLASSLGELLPSIGPARSGPLREALGLADRNDEHGQDADEVLTQLFSAAIAQSLLRYGGARFALSWHGPAQLLAAAGGAIDPAPVVRAAVTGADGGAALLAWLRRHDVRDLTAAALLGRLGDRSPGR